MAASQASGLASQSSGGLRAIGDLEELACLERWLEEALVRAASESEEGAAGGPALGDSEDPFGWGMALD